MQDFFHQQYVSLPEGIRYVGNHWLWQGGGSFQIFLEFPPWKLGKISILTNIFQMGWNHQLDEFSHFFKAAGFARLFESAACLFFRADGWNVIRQTHYCHYWVLRITCINRDCKDHKVAPPDRKGIYDVNRWRRKIWMQTLMLKALPCRGKHGTQTYFCGARARKFFSG